jgi:hypothetical protein
MGKPNSNCRNCDEKNKYDGTLKYTSFVKIESSHKVNNSTNVLKWPRYYGKEN